MDEQLLNGLRRGPWNSHDLNDVFAQSDGISTVPGGDADDLYATPQVVSRIVRGLANGDFREPPPDTSAAIDDVTNKLPGWSFVTVQGTSITAYWVADTTPGGGSVRFDHASGTANDEAYLEQVTQLDTSQYDSRMFGCFLSSTGASVGANVVPRYGAQFLDAAGATVGAEDIGNATTSTVHDLYPAGFAYAPNNVSFMRARLGVKRTGTSASTGSVTYYDASVRAFYRTIAVTPLTDHTHSASGSGASGGGSTLSPLTLNLPSATSPSQTDEGSIVWDSDDDVLTVGTGASRRTQAYVGSTTPTTQAMGDAATAGTGSEAAMIGHKHAMPTLGYGLSGNSAPAVGLTTASAYVTAETTLSSASYADISGASVSLAAGTWLVIGHVNGRVVNAHALMLVAITDGSNNVISEGHQSIPASGTASVNALGNVTVIAIVSPGGTTTYKLRGARGNTTLTTSWIAVDGNGVGVSNNASDNTDKGTGIFAVRIA